MMNNINANLNKTLRIAVANIVLICLAMLSSGCAVALEGTVIDKATGKPIAGAIVATSWTGYASMIVQTQHVCYDLEVTTTDERGRFTVATFGKLRPFLQNKNRGTSVFVPGYQIDPASHELNFIMVLRQGKKSEQFAKANRYQRNAGCPDDEKNASIYESCLQRFGVTGRDKRRA